MGLRSQVSSLAISIQYASGDSDRSRVASSFGTADVTRAFGIISGCSSSALSMLEP